MGLAEDANVLAISHFRYSELLLTLSGVLNQQFKDRKEKRLIPVLFLISKPQISSITKLEPGV